jgi:hypothetical protein
MAVTWNPSDKGANITLSNGNLDAEGSGAIYHAVRATTSHSTGKRYYEVLIVAGSVGIPGYADSGASLTTFIGNSNIGAGQGINTGDFGHVSGGGMTIVNVTDGVWAATDVVNLAINFTTQKIWIGKNGTWRSGDPAADTNPWVTFTTTNALFPAYAAASASDKGRLRTTNAQFTNTVPSGFLAWESLSPPPFRRPTRFFKRSF